MSDEPRKRLICTSNHAHWRTCYGTDAAGHMFRAMLGEHAETAGPPYVRTFTPDHDAWFETDAEEAFAWWLEANDPETALLARLGTPASYTLEIDSEHNAFHAFTYEETP